MRGAGYRLEATRMRRRCSVPYGPAPRSARPSSSPSPWSPPAPPCCSRCGPTSPTRRTREAESVRPQGRLADLATGIAYDRARPAGRRRHPVQVVDGRRTAGRRQRGPGADQRDGRPRTGARTGRTPSATTTPVTTDDGDAWRRRGGRRPSTRRRDRRRDAGAARAPPPSTGRRGLPVRRASR